MRKKKTDMASESNDVMFSNSANVSDSNPSVLKIIPLGGLEQIGMNITAFEYEDSIIVVDCGLAFPEDDMLGIDLVIPDVTYLKDNVAEGDVIITLGAGNVTKIANKIKEMN